ncbi:MAG: Gfo/Idh/MocA family oxidoreductase [Magnetococcales bacterium]|nr:Gfo/Idh/MocA family oxidoreductase [Magnetococcales bacterium]
MKRFLLVGLGSIGQRHARLLRQILGDQVALSCWRQRKLNVIIDDQLSATFDRSPEEHYGIRSLPSLEEALQEPDLDGVFVTNPIADHMAIALAAARHGKHIFIEKPLASSWQGVAELDHLVRERGLVCTVAYMLRFHPAMRTIRALLQAGRLGRLVAANFHFGESLPYMHPYEDYRQGHMARRDQGGGVIFCLSHEIDSALWLLGKPASVCAVGGHLSQLQLAGVEDTASLLFAVPQTDGRTIPVHVHLNFLQRPAQRFMTIIGEKGWLHWDYFANAVDVYDGETRQNERVSFADFQRNDMFLDELNNFLAALDGKETLVTPLQAGMDVLAVCLAAHQALQSGQVEKVV